MPNINQESWTYQKLAKIKMNTIFRLEIRNDWIWNLAKWKILFWEGCLGLWCCSRVYIHFQTLILNQYLAIYRLFSAFILISFLKGYFKIVSRFDEVSSNFLDRSSVRTTRLVMPIMNSIKLKIKAL